MSRNSKDLAVAQEPIGAALLRPREAQTADVSPVFMVNTRELCNADDLREASRGADLKIVQLAPGALDGQLTHCQVGSLSVSAGDFSAEIRARGVMNPDRVTLGMMTASSGTVKQWDYDVLPGDIVVFPTSVEQEGHFTGSSKYVTLTVDGEELDEFCDGEPLLQCPGTWTDINRFRPSPSVRPFIRREIANRIGQLRQGAVPTSAATADYLKRSILEAFVAGILDHLQVGDSGRDYRTSSALVRAVEDYVDSFDVSRPVHISELCRALRVSRRTLHLAFHQTLGCGPVKYLRLRSLAAVRSRLLNDRSASLRIADIALEAGFQDLGRFGRYYRDIYGERPSHTRQRRFSKRFASA